MTIFQAISSSFL